MTRLRRTSDPVRSAWFDAPRPRVLAHRGLALDAPENTIPAFAAAIEAGASYLETDVHVTRDGVAVVAHDPTLERVARRRDAIADLTLAELQTVDLGGGVTMPTLADALVTFGEARFNIDVKTDAAVDATVATVVAGGATPRVLLTSFSDRRRRRLASRVAGVATSAGSGAVFAARLAAYIASPLLLRLAIRGAHALQVPERWKLLRIVTPRFVTTAHRAGIEVHVWTVNDVADMRRLLDLGVDGLVTDRADIALDEVARRHERHGHPPEI